MSCNGVLLEIAARVRGSKADISVGSEVKHTLRAVHGRRQDGSIQHIPAHKPEARTVLRLLQETGVPG